MKKAGVVALIGRPNVGKSTLLNNLIGHKLSITSPKPQTTRFALQAIYADKRGQIIFVDTPGIFAKAQDLLSKKINPTAENILAQDIDLILYLIDPTRHRDLEENKTLGLIRKSPQPKILVVNKIDTLKPNYWAEYAFYTDEFNHVVKISALKKTNLNLLLNLIFELLPQGKPLVKTNQLVQPGLNIDSKLFIAEIIREKVFLFTHKELPYSVQTEVTKVLERDNGTLFVSGNIITTNDKYKKMLIGKKGRLVKTIGMAARKELELATNKKVYLELDVEVNPHWMEKM